jgi:sugar phosphate isomerase/epimerase
MGLPGEPDFSLKPGSEMMRNVKTAMAETGVGVLDVELARVVAGMDMTRYERACEAAAELGAKHLLSSIWTEDRAFYVQKFGEVCDLAQRYGLTADLEYVPISGVRNLSGALDVLNAVARDNMGLVIDIHHFHRAGDSVEDLAQVPREYFHYCQLCDAPAEIPTSEEEMRRIMREARAYVGEGGIDVASILDAMPEIPCSIELPNLSRSRVLGNCEFAARCLETTKKYLNEHPHRSVGLL